MNRMDCIQVKRNTNEKQNCLLVYDKRIIN